MGPEHAGETRVARRLFFVAGEPSGDQHAAGVIRALRAADPKLSIRAFGGGRMAAAGAEVLVDLASDAVMGLFLVLRRLPEIRGWFRRACRELDEHRPDAVVLVDYPGFNLRLAAEARRRGIRVIDYIGPQVWAWKRRRLAAMRRNVDLVIAILPFEPALYAEAGIPVHFPGHPVDDHFALATIDGALAEDLARSGSPVVGLFPGSRRHVVRALAPVFAGAARELGGRPGFERASFVFAAASPALAEEIEAANRTAGLHARVVTGRAPEVMRAMDFAITASGTTTIEITACEKPMVLAYRVSPILYWIARRLVKVPFIGLVNLVAGRGVVPEIIDWRDFRSRLADEAHALWTEPGRREAMIAALRDTHAKLASPGSYQRTAERILEELSKAPGSARRGE